MQTTFDRRMSESDALIWQIEQDPELRSTINVIWLLDCVPDRARLDGSFGELSRVVPRLRQRVARSPFSLASPRWEEDLGFDLSYHLRWQRVAGHGSLQDLLEMIQPLAMQAFDRARPLWECVVIDGLEGGRAAMLLRIHHAISDGVGLVHMTAGLVQRSREAGAPLSAGLPHMPPIQMMSFAERFLDALGIERQRQGARVRRAIAAMTDGLGDLIRRPIAAALELTETLRSVGHLLRPMSERLSPLLRGRSIGLRLATYEVDFARLKASAHFVGGTVNDAFIAAVTGGLRHYHEAHGTGAVPAELRMTMPINLRSGEDAQRAGNQFVPMRFLIPIALADPVERMREIRARIVSERAEPALPLVGELAGLFARFPNAVATAILGSMMKSVDLVTTNVPGPHFDVYLAGAKIESMFGFGPLTGAALNVTAFSYAGRFEIGISMDPAAVEDPEDFVACLKLGFDEVLALVPVAGLKAMTAEAGR